LSKTVWSEKEHRYAPVVMVGKNIFEAEPRESKRSRGVVGAVVDLVKLLPPLEGSLPDANSATVSGVKATGAAGSSPDQERAKTTARPPLSGFLVVPRGSQGSTQQLPRSVSTSSKTPQQAQPKRIFPILGFLVGPRTGVTTPSKKARQVSEETSTSSPKVPTSRDKFPRRVAVE